jgi:threonyl-tRNA synthetase
MRNFAGKEDTAFTVQYDFVMPKRFKLSYIDKDQQEKEPIVIHRSSIGAIERTMAFLIEHYAGAFPVWLAPLQVMVIPIADRHLDYAYKLEAELKSVGVRVEVDARSETVNLKIRQAQLNKIPYMLVVGDKEVAAATISIRLRSGKQLVAQSLDDFKESVRIAITNKVKDMER